MPDEVPIPTQPTAVASAVSQKIPDFWPSDPELWFAQAEALFAAQNITQEKTKFGHVVCVLPAQYSLEVRLERSMLLMAQQGYVGKNFKEHVLNLM